MLRLAPTFGVARPRSLAEALDLAATEGASLLGGGTDLLPNLKHGLGAPRLLVSLASVPGLSTVAILDDVIEIGALVTLDALGPQIAGLLPSLAAAVGQVAGPQHRRMGTLAGNVCQDTRCIYINEPRAWRQALGGCLKADGDVCHVVPRGRNCVASTQSDTAPVLMSLGARFELASAAGVREVAADDFWTTDGTKSTAIAPGEVLTRVRVPRLSPARRTGFQKLRTRGAIDFPLLNLAVAFDLDEGRLSAPAVVVGALGPRPKRLSGMPDGALDDALIDRMAEAVYRQVKPLDNIAAGAAWRRDMAPVLFRRALADALGGDR